METEKKPKCRRKKKDSLGGTVPGLCLALSSRERFAIMEQLLNGRNVTKRHVMASGVTSKYMVNYHFKVLKSFKLIRKSNSKQREPFYEPTLLGKAIVMLLLEAVARFEFNGDTQ